MRALAFDPESVILTSEGALYVLNRRGISSIRSKNIHKVHDALRPFLVSQIDEETLLTSVPPSQKRTIEIYLAKLEEVGAIRYEKGLSASQGDGADVKDEAQESSVLFLGPEQVRRELLSLDRRKIGAKRAIYVALTNRPSPDSEFDSARREAYTRLLLQKTGGPGRDAGGIDLFQMNERTGALTRLLSIEKASPPALRGVAQQLKLVAPEDLDQVPLVIVTVAHSFFPVKITRIGLRYDFLYEVSIREFLVKTLLSERPERITWFLSMSMSNTRDQKLAGPPPDIDAQAVERLRVAGCRLHLLVGLLEDYAYSMSKRGGHVVRSEVDLLKEDGTQPDVAYLASVLQMRMQSLPASLSVTESGLYIYESYGCRGYSFLRAKALREILLAAAWKEFYARCPDREWHVLPHNDFGRFRKFKQLQSLFNDREERVTGLHGPVPLRYGKMRAWGRTAWAGYIPEKSR